MLLKKQQVIVYTDGSCHTQHKIGAWAAILFVDNAKKIITAVEKDTTHNRMELIAVIATIKYLRENSINFSELVFVTDSQYVSQLPIRKQKLEQSGFHNKSGNSLPNSDLLQQLFSLLDLYPISFQKVKAHQKKSENTKYNIEVDLLVRKTLRETMQNTGL